MAWLFVLPALMDKVNAANVTRTMAVKVINNVTRARRATNGTPTAYTLEGKH
jgi:hypothetical protein